MIEKEKMMPKLKSALLPLAMIAGAGLILAAPALAGDDKKETSEKNETIVIKIVKADHQGGAADIAKHEKMAMIMEKCGDGVKTIATSADETKTTEGVKHSRIILCAKESGHDRGAAALSALEKARERVASIAELSAESKAKALAALDQEIARMKAATN
jgi:hypothetical protein